MTSKVSHCTEDFLNFQDLENQLSQICYKSELEECLRQQLSEIEMLQAMYANPGEFVMENPGQLRDVEDFVSGKSSIIPQSIDFTINLCFDNMKMEFCVALPLDYPLSEPDVFIRNNSFSRYQQQKLNEHFRSYMNELEKGEPCLYSLTCWLQENIDQYVDKQSAKLEKKNDDKKGSTFSRLWIYSHHIYSKTKRKDMLSYAADLNVTGFILPGKPGIICVEGFSDDCEEWWGRVKAMNWKKIIVRKTETFPVNNQESHNKFETFEEIVFKNNNRSSDDRHMDMGEFHKFLEEHSCDYVFIDYFGFNSRTNN